jgi:hypothetical protein
MFRRSASLVVPWSVFALHCYESVLVFVFRSSTPPHNKSSRTESSIAEHGQHKISEHELSLQELLFQELWFQECSPRSPHDKCVMREICPEFHSVQSDCARLSPWGPSQSCGCQKLRVRDENRSCWCQSCGSEVPWVSSNCHLEEYEIMIPGSSTNLECCILSASRWWRISDCVSNFSMEEVLCVYMLVNFRVCCPA